MDPSIELSNVEPLNRWHDGPRWLPPELIAHIIGNLRYSPPDLCRCALVCKAWAPPSRSGLFYRIIIRPNYPFYSRCLRLFDVLKQSPNLGLHVCELEVALLGDLNEIREALLWILGLFTRLRMLRLDDIIWESLTPEWTKSLLDILSLPSLVHLRFQNAYFSGLEHVMDPLFPHLKRLDLDIQWWTENKQRVEQSATVDLAREPCRLDYLRLRLSTQSIHILDWILHTSAIDLSNLCTLDLGFFLMGADSAECGWAEKFIRCLPVSLEHLSICYRVDKLEPFGNCNDLVCLPNLLTLSLWVGPHRDTASYLTYTFSKLTSPVLQQVYFEVTFPISVIWGDWTRLDSILDGHMFRSLRSVNVALIVDISMDPNIALQKFVDGFPKLNSRGLLDVNVSSESPSRWDRAII